MNVNQGDLAYSVRSKKVPMNVGVPVTVVGPGYRFRSKPEAPTWYVVSKLPLGGHGRLTGRFSIRTGVPLCVLDANLRRIIPPLGTNVTNTEKEKETT